MGRLTALRNDFKTRKLGYREFYQAFLKATEDRNKKLNAYLEIFSDEILARATKLDEQPTAGRLAGLPIGVKDMISIENRRLGAASRMLEGYVAPRSATVTERLLKEDALLVGRLNCDEFAMGSSNENSAYGPSRNPFDLERTAGGSSGGSAAAVAGELCVAALGTDTGGSIRLPAAFCGIVGLKPTYGRVSRSGVIAFASSLDQVGPMADDALDCAEVFQAIAGADPRDQTTLKVPVDSYVDAVTTGSLKGKKIGLPKEFFTGEGLDPEVQKLTDQTLKTLETEGAQLVSVSLPHSPYGIAVYYLVATAEAASNLARYDGVRYGHRAEAFDSMKDMIVRSRSEGFGPEVKRRIMLGTFSLSSGYFDAYYAKAQFVRSKIQTEYLAALQNVDVLFAPVSPTAAFKLGEKVNDPLQMYLVDIFTVSVNLAGLPALAFPIGHTSSGLPVGAQFIGRPFGESALFGALGAFERAHPHQKGRLAC